MKMEMEKRRKAMEVEEGRRRQRQNRQVVLSEFRTPQHPSLGSNNWGGASPMLARNIPKEALDQRYQRLCSIRNRDEIYPVQGNENDDFSSFLDDDDGSLDHDQYSPRSSRFRGTAFLLKLVRPMKNKKKKKKKENRAQLGDAAGKKKRKYWNLPRWDPKTRWPQGWC